MRTRRNLALTLGLALVTGLAVAVVGGVLGRTPARPVDPTTNKISTVELLDTNIARHQ
jgi:hypothetical protein